MNIQPVHVQGGPGHKRLAKTVRATLGSFLGTGFTRHVSPPESEPRPIAAGLCAAVLYAVIPIALKLCKPSSPELFLLFCWGAVYCGLVVTLTRSTSRAVVEIVEVLILPNVSEAFAETVRAKIEKNFSRPRTLWISLCVATTAMLISWVLLWQFHWVRLCLWGIGFFILFFTGAQATLTAPFYTCFSSSLKEHTDVLFFLDPAASPAVSVCTALARRILWYWFVVFVFLVSLIAVLYVLGTSSVSGSVLRFVSIVVLVAGFFSFGFGSLVFLEFERDLRVAIDKVRLATLSTVQARYDEVFQSRGVVG